MNRSCDISLKPSLCSDGLLWPLTFLTASRCCVVTRSEQVRSRSYLVNSVSPLRNQAKLRYRDMVMVDEPLLWSPLCCLPSVPCPAASLLRFVARHHVQMIALNQHQRRPRGHRAVPAPTKDQWLIHPFTPDPDYFTLFWLWENLIIN